MARVPARRLVSGPAGLLGLLGLFDQRGVEGVGIGSVDACFLHEGPADGLHFSEEFQEDLLVGGQLGDQPDRGVGGPTASAACPPGRCVRSW